MTWPLSAPSPPNLGMYPGQKGPAGEEQGCQKVTFVTFGFQVQTNEQQVPHLRRMLTAPNQLVLMLGDYQPDASPLPSGSHFTLL